MKCSKQQRFIRVLSIFRTSKLIKIQSELQKGQGFPLFLNNRNVYFHELADCCDNDEIEDLGKVHKRQLV